MKRSLLLLALLRCATASAGIIHVPGDQPTIQAGIDAALDGDTVLVEPGFYHESIRFHGKAIAVRSRLGPMVTAIEWYRELRTVSFADHEGRDSIIEGFTIRHGAGGSPSWATTGGGIDFTGASPTIRNNIIRDCVSSVGAGIHGVGSALIEGNIIWTNDALKTGGGLALQGSCVLRNNVIALNRVKWGDARGGGLVVTGDDPVIITNNTFFSNIASGQGGGAVLPSSAVLTNNVFWDNFATSQSQIQGSPKVTFCDVQGGWPGKGNIDADPQFVNPYSSDCHILYGSPCRDAGDASAPELPPWDIDGNPRIDFGAPDLGADEFSPCVYWFGYPQAGQQILIRLVGVPGSQPVLLHLGSGVFDPPLPSPWGDWYLQFPIASLSFAEIPPSGVLRFNPGLWTELSGVTIPLQGFVGDRLTNLSLLPVQ